MQTIYLDISNKGVIPCIQAKQSEVGRKFLAVITDNGVPYKIPNNSLLSVWYEGDTDAGNYSSINEKSAFVVDGNKVSVELVAQMLIKPGKGELCLSITHGDVGETNTWNIPYEVEYKPGAGSSVPTEYYTALLEVAANAAKSAQEAKEAAEKATQAVSGAYPVGSVYISVSENDPSQLFGGKWEKIKDRFLLSSGDTYNVGETGGNKTKTLSVDELPSHRHGTSVNIDASGTNTIPAGQSRLAADTYIYSTANVDNKGKTSFGETGSAGNGAAFSIMPPFITVNVWKRIS